MDVAITFDDGLHTDSTRVAPLLKSYNFNASFFITPKDVWSAILVPRGLPKIRQLSKDELISLYKDGFDIGNHTFSHINLLEENDGAIKKDVLLLNRWFNKLGVTTPTTFSYPTFRSSERAANLLRGLGFKAARTGFADTPDKLWHAVPALRPKKYFKKGDDPLRIFTTAVLNSNYTMDWFKRDLEECPDGGLMVITGHGVSENYVWQLLQDMVKYLADNGSRFISLAMI